MEEDENPCQIHIQISSTDRPGILAEVLEFVVAFDWDVLDIKQFVFNGLLNLSLLLGSNKSNAILGLQGVLDEWAVGNGIALQVLPWEKRLRPEAPYKHRSVVTLKLCKIYFKNEKTIYCGVRFENCFRLYSKGRIF